VLCFRNLEEVVPSWLNLWATGQLLTSASVLAPAVVKNGLHHLDVIVNGLMSHHLKHTLGHPRVVTCDFKTLMTNPVKIVQDVYENSGHQYSDVFHDNILKYVKEKPLYSSYGRHSYSLEKFGLSVSDIALRYGKFQSLGLFPNITERA